MGLRKGFRFWGLRTWGGELGGGLGFRDIGIGLRFRRSFRL